MMTAFRIVNIILGIFSAYKVFEIVNYPFAFSFGAIAYAIIALIFLFVGFALPFTDIKRWIKYVVRQIKVRKEIREVLEVLIAFLVFLFAGIVLIALVFIYKWIIAMHPTLFNSIGIFAWIGLIALILMRYYDVD